MSDNRNSIDAITHNRAVMRRLIERDNARRRRPRRQEPSRGGISDRVVEGVRARLREQDVANPPPSSVKPEAYDMAMRDQADKSPLGRLGHIAEEIVYRAVKGNKATDDRLRSLRAHSRYRMGKMFSSVEFKKKENKVP